MLVLQAIIKEGVMSGRMEDNETGKGDYDSGDFGWCG